MTPIHITIPGEPRTKKNSGRLVGGSRDGRMRYLPSKAFMQYQVTAGWYITYKRLMIREPVNVQCVYYMRTHRRVDLGNLIAATCDILTHYGVLADDNSDIVVSHDGSRVLYDKDNPRAEIHITPIEQEPSK